MSQFIELQRSRLEEIDVIRQSTFKRFRKNPEVIPPIIREKDDVLALKATKPHHETLLQKHEIKLFSDRYSKLMDQISSTKQQQQLVQQSLEKLEDSGKDFKMFDTLYEQLRSRRDTLIDENLLSLYSMYSSSPMEEVKTTKNGKLKVRKKYILSQEGRNKIDADNLFTHEEQYGKFIDVHRFYDIYRELNKKDVSYLEFLHDFGNCEGVKFENYNSQLIEYLLKFIERTEPLSDINNLHIAMEGEFFCGKAVEGVYTCKPCDRAIKESAFKSHIVGKKHKKNVNKMTIDKQEFQKFKLKYLQEYLKEKIQNTINNVERKNAMTERERMIENEVDESDYTTADSEPSSDSEVSEDEDNDLFKELPLGADGVPIPFWLYKLQGLHHSYNCEICGNMEYKGRISFEKHFGTHKHQQGLRFLGVDDESLNLFTNISKIEEAMDLWKIIKRERREKEGEMENTVEVEDNEGNVMSERDYLQLKRQGII
ncbi:pre-mRNA-splicing factor Prp9p [[Candida] jaroonii]|uniref:Pre-mRNA-splicing factor Prp9p n=1 Tax=[Candida] jaroonii TaxID=467808 RepID=A0ACA9Y1U0_9ASCO|nr:pre-mRNA-splicing factor Prp9p [[Candida] jaroonii]